MATKENSGWFGQWARLRARVVGLSQRPSAGTGRYQWGLFHSSAKARTSPDTLWGGPSVRRLTLSSWMRLQTAGFALDPRQQ